MISDMNDANLAVIASDRFGLEILARVRSLAN